MATIKTNVFLKEIDKYLESVESFNAMTGGEIDHIVGAAELQMEKIFEALDYLINEKLISGNTVIEAKMASGASYAYFLKMTLNSQIEKMPNFPQNTVLKLKSKFEDESGKSVLTIAFDTGP